MTIQQLRYLSAVVECGSISKAAQKLYVSQPSVSAVIHALEDELDISVFSRSSKGITITQEGRELLKMGNKILQDVDYYTEREDFKLQEVLFHVSTRDHTAAQTSRFCV